MPAVGPVKRHVHHLRATCDAREPVCLHENTPGELAPLKLIRPGGFVSIWSARSLHFSWNGAELWLALEEEHKRGGQLAARSPPKIPSTRAKRFHVRLHGHGMSSKSQTRIHYRGIAVWGCKNEVLTWWSLVKPIMLRLS